MRQLIADLLQKDPNMRPYAGEIMDTVSDMVYKSQANRFIVEDAIINQDELHSGLITNGAGLGLHRVQKFVIQRIPFLY